LLFVLPFDFFKHWHVMPHPSSLFRFAVPRALGASLAITCSLRQPAIISFFPDASFACRGSSLPLTVLNTSRKTTSAQHGVSKGTDLRLPKLLN
jgi:hypothetical protein